MIPVTKKLSGSKYLGPIFYICIYTKLVRRIQPIRVGKPQNIWGKTIGWADLGRKGTYSFKLYIKWPKHNKIMTLVERRKFRWFAHMSRSDVLAKTILKGTVKRRIKAVGSRREGTIVLKTGHELLYRHNLRSCYTSAILQAYGIEKRTEKNRIDGI